MKIMQKEKLYAIGGESRLRPKLQTRGRYQDSITTLYIRVDEAKELKALSLPIKVRPVINLGKSNRVVHMSDCAVWASISGLSLEGYALKHTSVSRCEDES